MSRKEPLAPLTTFKVGGPAAVVARPASLEELVALLLILQRRGCPWRVLGRGSNLLVADRGYAGVVILLGRRLARIEPWAASAAASAAGDEESPGAASGGVEPGGPAGLVRVEAGCSLAALLGWAQHQGLGGLEFLAGIPGSVGGALIMNAGAHGHCLGERVRALDLVSAAGVSTTRHRRGEVEQGWAGALYREAGAVPATGERRHSAGLKFGYRRLQGLAPGEVVAAAVLALEPRNPGEIRDITRRHRELRRAGQPRGVASAGSFFKNPPGDYAGRLIEVAGMKGLRQGDAEVSPLHANFLVNRGAARAADLLALAQRVRAAVREQTGVELEPEVHLLGFE